jgi:hypothetical protein
MSGPSEGIRGKDAIYFLSVVDGKIECRREGSNGESRNIEVWNDVPPEDRPLLTEAVKSIDVPIHHVSMPSLSYRQDPSTRDGQLRWD